MKNILKIETSLFAENSHSNGLAESLLQEWQQQGESLQVTVRRLTADSIPHLDRATFEAFSVAENELTIEQKKRIALSDQLLAEIEQADRIVLAVPLYNFGIPSSLKAYFDHIARAGRSFRYTETGPVGLLRDRPVYILATRGGRYLGTQMDTQTPYLKHFLAFLGLNDLRFVYAEGLAMQDHQKQSLAAARHELSRLAA